MQDRSVGKFGVVGYVVGAFLVLALLIGGVYAFRWFTADARGELDAREQIQADGSFRIAAYNHFFDLCSAIQAQEDRASILQGELDDPNTTPERAAQVRASLSAIEAQRAEQVRGYNADASKDYTSGQFKDSDLPYEIDLEGTTECVI